jgi:YVTN family beta-propeller protein
MAITPDGKRVYVGNTLSQTVSVIDTTTNAVVATVTGLHGPTGIAVTQDGKSVYVADQDSASASGFVSVINTATNSVVATVKVKRAPFGVAIGPSP